MDFKGNHFIYFEIIQEAMTEKLKNIPETDFSRIMEKLEHLTGSGAIKVPPLTTLYK